ncbi:MAG: Tim44/TimA family putative adaptor protein [Holosporaceae bacterium]|jgi:predicted lipid-binding transport protein (Tim44 family)|nr:Tim44/TimA family putative adaptor protein [Holosporaceae bacterium]
MFGLFFFIALTVYLVTRLNDILGTRTGFYADKENLRDFSGKNITREAVVTEKKNDDMVSAVKDAYPMFDAKDFLNKAQKAFEIIFTAYSKGDTKTLKGLLSPRIFHAFSMAIEDRKKRREVLEGILVRFVNSEITNVSSERDEIFITVKFETEQSNVLKSEDGAVLEGNTDFIEKRTEIWIFYRKKSSDDSRWYLYEIKSD